MVYSNNIIVGCEVLFGGIYSNNIIVGCEVLFGGILK